MAKFIEFDGLYINLEAITSYSKNETKTHDIHKIYLYDDDITIKIPQSIEGLNHEQMTKTRDALDIIALIKRYINQNLFKG